MRMICMFFVIMSNNVIAKKNKNLPQSLILENREYKLCKEHTIKYAYLIKIAHVGLYLKNCSNTQNILKIPDKLIRFNYLVDVKASVFIEAAEEFFLKNLNYKLESQEVAEMNGFNQFYKDIQTSDYYDLYHHDGQILKLLKNNNLLGSSQNSEFSFDYFNIWFGQYPAVKPLKKAFISKGN